MGRLAIIDWGVNLTRKRGISFTKDSIYDAHFVSSLILHFLELLEPKYGGYVEGHQLHPSKDEDLNANIKILMETLPATIIPYLEEYLQCTKQNNPKEIEKTFSKLLIMFAVYYSTIYGRKTKGNFEVAKQTLLKHINIDLTELSYPSTQSNNNIIITDLTELESGMLWYIVSKKIGEKNEFAIKDIKSLAEYTSDRSEEEVLQKAITLAYRYLSIIPFFNIVEFKKLQRKQPPIILFLYLSQLYSYIPTSTLSSSSSSINMNVIIKVDEVIEYIDHPKSAPQPERSKNSLHVMLNDFYRQLEELFAKLIIDVRVINNDHEIGRIDDDDDDDASLQSFECEVEKIESQIITSLTAVDGSGNGGDGGKGGENHRSAISPSLLQVKHSLSEVKQRIELLQYSLLHITKHIMMTTNHHHFSSNNNNNEGNNDDDDDDDEEEEGSESSAIVERIYRNKIEILENKLKILQAENQKLEMESQIVSKSNELKLLTLQSRFNDLHSNFQLLQSQHQHQHQHDDHHHRHRHNDEQKQIGDDENIESSSRSISKTEKKVTEREDEIEKRKIESLKEVILVLESKYMNAFENCQQKEEELIDCKQQFASLQSKFVKFLSFLPFFNTKPKRFTSEIDLSSIDLKNPFDILNLLPDDDDDDVVCNDEGGYSDDDEGVNFSSKGGDIRNEGEERVNNTIQNIKPEISKEMNEGNACNNNNNNTTFNNTNMFSNNHNGRPNPVFSDYNSNNNNNNNNYTNNSNNNYGFPSHPQYFGHPYYPPNFEYQQNGPPQQPTSQSQPPYFPPYYYPPYPIVQIIYPPPTYFNSFYSNNDQQNAQNTHHSHK